MIEMANVARLMVSTLSFGSSSTKMNPIAGSEDHQIEKVHRTPPTMPIAMITTSEPSTTHAA